MAEEILRDLRKKEQEQNDLEYLQQSLASFGAVRLLERPYRRQLCSKVLERKAEAQRGVCMGVDSKGAKDFGCGCGKAHSAAQLRFPAGESVPRRVAWVKEATLQITHVRLHRDDIDDER